MEQLYTFITNKLKAIHPNVGFEQVSEETFPYVTYRFENSTPLAEGDREDVTIEVDVWNRYTEGKDAALEIERLTKKIEKALKRERHLDGSTFFLFQLIGKLNISDPDATILRRQLRFRVRVYE